MIDLLEDCPVDQFILPSEWNEIRIDKVLALKYVPLHSRSYFQELIEKGCVFIDGKIALKKRLPVYTGNLIEVRFENQLPPEVVAEDVPLDILYEDRDLLIINKPPGLVVHPAPGHWSGTLVNGLMYHCKDALPGDKLRPGIVHRLDKDTSGLVVAVKTANSLRQMTDLFATRQVHKQYLAICIGNPGDRTIDASIGRHPKFRQKMAVLPEGKSALTSVKTLYSHKGLSLVEVTLHTGRTHQIRVHLQHIGCPLLGDREYGSSLNQRYSYITHQMLHAWKLSFTHPQSKQSLDFSIAPPQCMLEAIQKNFSLTYQKVCDYANAHSTR